MANISYISMRFSIHSLNFSRILIFPERLLKSLIYFKKSFDSFLTFIISSDKSRNERISTIFHFLSFQSSHKFFSGILKNFLLKIVDSNQSKTKKIIVNTKIPMNGATFYIIYYNIYIIIIEFSLKLLKTKSETLDFRKKLELYQLYQDFIYNKVLIL